MAGMDFREIHHMDLQMCSPAFPQKTPSCFKLLELEIVFLKWIVFKGEEAEEDCFLSLGVAKSPCSHKDLSCVLQCVLPALALWTCKLSQKQSQMMSHI